MYPSQVNTPRLYAMIFGFFSLTAIYVVATASVNLTQDAGKMVYVAQAEELSAPLVDSGLGTSAEAPSAPTIAPLPVLISPPPVESAESKVESNNQPNIQPSENQPNNQSTNSDNNQPSNQPNNQPNNQQNNFQPNNNFNNQPGMNQPNEMMGPEGEQNDEQDQGPQFDAEGIKNGVQAARGGFDKFVSEFKNVGPFIIKFKAAKRVAGTVKPKQAAEKLCPLIADLLARATDLQTKLAAASADVAEGYGFMAAALDVATHVMALEAVVLEESGDTVSIDTGEEDATTASSCQAANDLRGTIKMMNPTIKQMTGFTRNTVKEINKNKKILATMLKKVDQLGDNNDIKPVMKLFGQAEQSAQKIINMTNGFLSMIINGLEQMN